MLQKIQNYLSLVKFSHTVFAMPFAIIGFFLATEYSGYQFKTILLLQVVLCMVFARNAAMAFNRYVDRFFDAENQRTAKREVPSGIIKPVFALVFIVINVMLFIATTFFINRLVFYLSPVALLVVLGYSYTKRFTWWCHFILGTGLALAPLGAYLSVTAKFHYLPVLFSLIVLLWTSGFDMIYALQDTEFDKKKRLYSIPAKFGKQNALFLSAIIHGIALLLVVLCGILADFNFWYSIGATCFGILLIYQHTIVKPNDLSRVNLAFFTTNGMASIIFAVFTIIDLFY